LTPGSSTIVSIGRLGRTAATYQSVLQLNSINTKVKQEHRYTILPLAHINTYGPFLSRFVSLFGLMDKFVKDRAIPGKNTIGMG
jgi:hypothetical protein